MSRLIDADALKEKKVYSHERHEKIVPVAEIDWMPTIDAVPVVRCRDCVYGCLSQNVCGEDRVFCENPDFEGMDYLVNEPDWFCADGERRNDNGKDA